MSGAGVVHYQLLHRPRSVPTALGPAPLATLTFNGVWHFGEVFFSRTKPCFSLYGADGRQRVWRRVGEWFADVNVVDRVAHGGGGVMVWAGVCYGQRTPVHFIDGILNAPRRDPEAHCCAIYPQSSPHVAA